MKSKAFILSIFILLGSTLNAQLLSGNLVISPGVHKIIYSEDMDECIMKNFQEGCDYISDTICMLVAQKLSEVFENTNLIFSYNLEPIQFDTLPFNQIVVKYYTFGAKKLAKTSMYYFFGKYGIPLCASNVCLTNDPSRPIVNKSYVADISKLHADSDYSLVFWTIYHTIGTVSGTHVAQAFVIYDLFDSKTGQIVFEEAIFGGTNMGSDLYQFYIEKLQMPAYNDLMEYVSFQVADNFMKKYRKLEKENEKLQKEELKQK